jgi:hypothetical protein
MKLGAGVAMTALAIGVLMAIAISLLPILYGRRAGSARSATATPVPAGMSRWRRGFVVVQLAVAVVVLSTAALLYRSADRLADVNPGFVAEGVSVFELMLPDSQYGSPGRRIELQRRLLESMNDLPGRHAAATVDFLPFGGDISVVNITIENHVVTDAAARPRAAFRAISESYFEVLSIPAVDGRAFVAADGAEDSRVAIVNEAFARRFVPGENVVGRRIRRGTAKSPSPWMTVVGVVGSVRGAGLGVDPEPEVFIPYAKSGAHSTVNLIVKAALPPSMLAPAVVERIHRADAALSPATITDMNELVARAVAWRRSYTESDRRIGP